MITFDYYGRKTSIFLKDIHYITYQYRTTWEMCQLLDSKYLHSSKRTIEDFYNEANKNKWIKSLARDFNREEV